MGALCLIEMLFLKQITDETEEFDVFDESSNLFLFKDWSTKAVPLNQAFALLCDMIDVDESSKKFDV